MTEKVTTMKLKVDLQCPSCFKKVKKILCKFPQIRDQVYDEKQNLVTITVVCCSPEKFRDKLCCKCGKCIKSIEIVVPKPDVKPKDEKEKPKPPPPIPVVVCCVPCSKGCGEGPCSRPPGSCGHPPPCGSCGHPPPCSCGHPPPCNPPPGCHGSCGRPPPCGSCGHPPPCSCGHPPPGCHGSCGQPPPGCHGSCGHPPPCGCGKGCRYSHCDYFSEQITADCAIM